MMGSNKDNAIAFLQLASSGKVREAYDRYVHPQFRHHNPYFKGDRASLMKGMEENATQFPDKELEVVRALEDGDLVAIHVHGKMPLNPDFPEIALVHIYRFEDGLIIEEWETGQEVPTHSRNEFGMF